MSVCHIILSVVDFGLMPPYQYILPCANVYTLTYTSEENDVYRIVANSMYEGRLIVANSMYEGRLIVANSVYEGRLIEIVGVGV